MPSHQTTETSAVRQLPVAARIALCLLAILLLAAANIAQAVPMTPAGFSDDAGDSYFVPGSLTLAIEVLDILDSPPGSEFGFFYRSTPGTLVPIFGADDITAAGPQFAVIDFGAGTVADADTVGPATLFAVLADDIGFYYTISGVLTLYSDPVLNTTLGGTDLFYAFQNIATPMQWALIFEGDTGQGLQNISLNILNPLTASVSAVPLPPTVYLMGSLVPILMFMSRRRRKLGAVAA